MKSIILGAAALGFVGVMSLPASASEPARAAGETAKAGVAVSTDISAQRRYYRRYGYGPRYYRPYPPYYGYNRYYAPYPYYRPYYGGGPVVSTPFFSFGFY